MSTVSERKVALQLLVLSEEDRGEFLSGLPHAESESIAGLVEELLSLPFPLTELVHFLLSEEASESLLAPALEAGGATALSGLLSGEWLSRAILAYPNDRARFLKGLSDNDVKAMEAELETVRGLPERVLGVLREELRLLAKDLQS